MPLLSLSVKTEIDWINETAKLPILGGFFLFILTFLPAVTLSFITYLVIPSLNNDIGFTKAMSLFLPAWNLFLWFAKIKLYFFHIPSWILFGIIALIKTILN
jgi:hypothetical protein